MIYEREWSNPNYDFASYTVDNLSWDLHFHEVFEICYVISGKMRIHIEHGVNGVEHNEYELTEGMGLIIFPRQLHSYTAFEDAKMQLITFMPTLTPEFANHYKGLIPKNNLLPDMRRYRDRLNPQNSVAKKGLLYSILGDLIENTEFVLEYTGVDTKLLIKVLRFVENNYMGDCSLRRAAAELSYGYTYLSRMFKSLMHLSYNEYLNKFRINRAIYLLSNEPDLQVQEIAAKCGYESLCSFNRNFKSFTGVSPTQWVKKNE